MRPVLGQTFRRPHTTAIVKVVGVKREKGGKAYVMYIPDFPNSHLCYGRMEVKRFHRLQAKQSKGK